MRDDDWKRRIQETERLSRLADPLRDAREQMKAIHFPLFGAQEQIAALMRNPLSDVQEQLKAMDPLQGLREEVQALQDQQIADRERIAALIQHPLLDVQEQLKAMVDPLHGFREQMRQAIGPRDDLIRQVQALCEPFGAVRDWIQDWREAEEERQRDWGHIFNDIARQLREVPDEVRSQLAVLLDRGWCLDPSMPHAWGRGLTLAFEDGQEEEGQQWLVSYFTDCLDEIEAALVERHPTRAHIISDAFKAHREGRYNLCIPVFLSQADGVVNDRFQRQLYSKKHTVSLRGLLDSLPDDGLRAMFIAAFCIDIPLTRNTGALPEGFDGLNRHAVLHGTDPAYGTQVNSLRAVSILNFASHLSVDEP